MRIIFLAAFILSILPTLVRGEEAASGTPVQFEIAAWVDHFDFYHVFDTEKPEGIAAILDHVAETGATTILWRNVAGSTMRYQSREDSHHNDSRLDKRRIPDNRPIAGWVRYGDVEPDIIETVVKMCRERGLKPGIHWPFEETHWAIWTIGNYNMEHPQYWGRTVDGRPWWGRVSIGFEPVIEHKLALVDELIDRGVECIFLDFFRNGGWGPQFEYVKPIIESYRKKYKEDPPADATDLRWVKHICGYVNEYMRRLHHHVKERNPKVKIMAGVPNIAPISDRTMVTHLADWRTWVKEGLIDTLVVNSVAWDKKRPMESTRELYHEIIDFVDGRCPVLFPVMAYNYAYDSGMPAYQRVTGKPQHEIAKELTIMAWEEGASGISLECVDYNNYKKPTRDLLYKLRKTKCRFTRQRK